MITMIKKSVTEIDPSYLVVSHHGFCTPLPLTLGQLKKRIHQSPIMTKKVRDTLRSIPLGPSVLGTLIFVAKFQI